MFDGYVLYLFVEIPLVHGRSDLSGKIDFLKDDLGLGVFFFFFFVFFFPPFLFPVPHDISLDP